MEWKLEGEWKLQLTAEISFVSLKPSSDNEEFMNGSDTDEISKGLFESIFTKM